MNAKMQRLCAWGGVGCTLLWLPGFWVLANWFAPHPPTWTPEQVATFFRTDTNMLRFALITLGYGCCLYLPWCAAISTQMRRIEGEHSVMSWAQLGMGSIGVWVFFLPVMLWITISYRADEMPPELMRYLNDFAWLTFINPVCMYFYQGLFIGITILNDKRAEPIFPRWFGWAQIWVIIIYLPGSLVPMFKTGPFAWNGALAWFIPLTVFVIWMMTMTYLLLKAIKRQETEYLAAGGKPA